MPEKSQGILVPFAQRHVPARVAWLSHAEVSAGVPIQGDITLDSTSVWAERVEQIETRGDFVYEDCDGVPRVMCGITSIDEGSRRGELYMFADPATHGSGHGSRALQLLCEWAFEIRKLNRVFLYTMGSNAGARRFYERIGFVEEGCLRQHALHQGQLEDRYVHGLLAQNWNRSQVGHHG